MKSSGARPKLARSSRAALAVGAAAAAVFAMVIAAEGRWPGRFARAFDASPPRSVSASSAAARALAGCYEGQGSVEPHPWWVPLAMVPMGRDSLKEHEQSFRLDPTPEYAMPAESERDPDWIPTYLVRDSQTGASRADHWWWTPVDGGGFLLGIRGWADYEDGIVHPTGRLRDGAPEFSGRWAGGGGFRHKILVRRVPCPGGPA